MLPPFPLSFAPSSFAFLAVVFVLALALMMMFVGSRLIHWLSFAVVGLMAAYLGSVVGNEFLGPIGSVLGFVGGFVIGGGSTVLFLPLGMGLGVGLACFAVAQSLIQIPFVPPLVGAVGFAYGFLLTDLLISAISALIGGLLLFDASLAAGLAPVEMFLVCGGLTAVGAATQTYLAGRARNLFGKGEATYRSRRGRSNRSQ